MFGDDDVVSRERRSGGFYGYMTPKHPRGYIIHDLSANARKFRGGKMVRG